MTNAIILIIAATIIWAYLSNTYLEIVEAEVSTVNLARAAWLNHRAADFNGDGSRCAWQLSTRRSDVNRFANLLFGGVGAASASAAD